MVYEIETEKGLGSCSIRDLMDYRLVQLKRLRHYGTCEICQMNGHIVRIHMCRDAIGSSEIPIDICNNCLTEIADPRFHYMEEH